ncbi:MAG: thioredoxin domain-containing protein [Candidatus Paceibacterota bacterium]
MKKKNTWIWIVVTLGIIIALVAFLVVQAKKPGKYDTFAQCITDSGAKFYGAWWCPHCQAQKALFGKSAKKLPYIECQTKDSKQTKQCDDLGIAGYPTWIFADGTKETGERTFAQLGAKTNCPVPTN